MPITQPPCPICQSTQCRPSPGGLPGATISDCPRCGRFSLIGTAATFLSTGFYNKTLNRSVLSHYTRKKQYPDKSPTEISEEDLKPYVGDHWLPNPQEQANNLVLWVGDHQRDPASYATETIQALAALIGVAINCHYAPDIKEPGFAWLWSQIKGEDLLQLDKKDDLFSLQLTMKGWSRYEELRHVVIDSHIAFMAMKFGDTTLSRVLDTCFKPAAENAGFTLRALNEEQAAGLIDNQIRAAIRTAGFVIADLTHDNNGAYFEAGFAEGLGLPVIYTCEESKFKDKKTHFDTNHMVTIPWNIKKLDEVGRKLTATIRATLPGKIK